MSSVAKQSALSFTEYWDQNSGLTFGIQNLLFSQPSEFQQVDVVQTDAFGRLMLLDGLVMVTDRDEFVYHEMISHPALCVHPNPKRVLVIGGGDGGTVREILRHPGIEHVDLVEIDGVVIDAAKQFFPAVASALFGHPKLSVHVADGLAFTKDAPAGSYDIILVDSTDPVGFAEGLFGEAFYTDARRALAPGGILVGQMESPFDTAFQRDITDAHRILGGLFPHVAPYLAHIPTYPMGTWSFVMASLDRHPVRDFDPAAAEARLAPFAQDLQYYNPDLHFGAFALPNFVKRLF